MHADFYAELIKEIIASSPNKDRLGRLKHQLCKKYKIARPPTDIDILIRTPDEQRAAVMPFLQSKPVRTASGVVPIAVMTKPLPCPHGKCTFCPGGPGSVYGDVPQSYTGREPSTMRALRNLYDPYLIVMNRLEQYTLLGHAQDKVELILQGGTFPAMDVSYQEEVVRDALSGLNDFGELFFSSDWSFDLHAFKTMFSLPGQIGDAKRASEVQERLLAVKNKIVRTLESEQERNETARIRCVGLTIETKPDWGKLAHGNEMLRLGCTRVEVGVQSVYDEVLHRTHRGHTFADTLECFAILKDLGFKITAHYMPGLPLTDRERDLAGMRQLFSDAGLKPDQLKIYPCMVAPGTPLYLEYQRGTFVPISADEAALRISTFKKEVPEYCRILRVNRDVPTTQWAAGVEMTNLRQHMDKKFPVECRCIRCREPKGEGSDQVELVVDEYDSSGGTEFFFHYEDKKNDAILGFCRMRYPPRSLRTEITTESALIRELHVYGQATALGAEGSVQHKGLGKKLMAEAESRARRDGKKKMVVISGIGVREYYAKLGYRREGPYMVKNL